MYELKGETRCPSNWNAGCPLPAVRKRVFDERGIAVPETRFTVWAALGTVAFGIPDGSDDKNGNLRK